MSKLGFFIFKKPMKKEDLVKLGFVSQPHGIRGEADLRLINTDDSVLDVGSKIWLYPSNERSGISPQGEEWEIKKIRFGNKVIAELEGIRDRTHLETLLPFEIYMSREDFPELDDGEVYLIDLIGAEVVNTLGQKIGRVEGFSDNSAQYLLDVRMETGEVLTLPYVDAFFPETDIENKRITMILPEYSE